MVTGESPLHARLDRSRHPPVLEVAGFGSCCCEHVRSLATVTPGTRSGWSSWNRGAHSPEKSTWADAVRTAIVTTAAIKKSGFSRIKRLLLSRAV